ncbi:hypothetical protein [Sinorhizobium mexicanum]|uniref:Uncharacterized protein n=1 Tax=Sinorhizobium mexicanum TaxID=375549 RepID=A0A859QQD8_9HYPH|nr:hypothetical protein [Sinorhizobium mexicanum]MBP1885048.1 hypothetical protein [Sinorhizobium mexicanum]QLL64317.1 hypothetical protein FKV68_23040 [Sinorhizobium mexicanum]
MSHASSKVATGLRVERVRNLDVVRFATGHPLVQVLHGFNSVLDAKSYLESALFNDDVVEGLKPLLAAAPEVRIYAVA